MIELRSLSNPEYAESEVRSLHDDNQRCCCCCCCCCCCVTTCACVFVGIVGRSQLYVLLGGRADIGSDLSVLGGVRGVSRVFRVTHLSIVGRAHSFLCVGTLSSSHPRRHTRAHSRSLSLSLSPRTVYIDRGVDYGVGHCV